MIGIINYCFFCAKKAYFHGAQDFMTALHIVAPHSVNQGRPFYKRLGDVKLWLFSHFGTFKVLSPVVA